MPETLIKVDLTQSAYDNDMIHNRWHPDVPMVAWVNPGDDFIVETYDWTGGFIKNNDSADDVRDIDLSIVHFLSGPIGVKGAEPGDLLVVDLLDVGPMKDSLWGFNGFFSKKNGGGFLTDHFPLAQKSIWDFKGMYTSSRHIPGVNFAGLIHPGLIGCLPDPKLLATWNERETALIATRTRRACPGSPIRRSPRPRIWAGSRATPRPRWRPKAPAPCRRASMAATATSRICRAARRSISRSMCPAAGFRWATCISARATARSPSAARSRWRAGCTSRSTSSRTASSKYGIKNPVFKPSPMTPNYKDYLIFEGISVDEEGKQHYLDVHIAYRQACLNAIEYLKKFGYSGAQAYSILGTAPCQGHISGVVDMPNACATLWLPTEIFDFDIMPSSAGPIKHIKGDIQMPLSQDK